MWNRWLCLNLLELTIIFSGIFYFINLIRSFYMISIIIINTKINFCILLFYKFYVFGNETKVQLKIYKKKYFRKSEFPFEDICNKWLCLILFRFSIIFSDIFYFINLICSFYMISMIIINTKINFCILLIYEFYVFWKWKKSPIKNLQKKYFRNLKFLFSDM